VEPAPLGDAVRRRMGAGVGRSKDEATGRATFDWLLAGLFAGFLFGDVGTGVASTNEADPRSMSIEPLAPFGPPAMSLRELPSGLSTRPSSSFTWGAT